MRQELQGTKEPDIKLKCITNTSHSHPNNHKSPRTREQPTCRVEKEREKTEENGEAGARAQQRA